MSYKFAWTEDNDVRVKWEGEEITNDPIDTAGNQRIDSDGVPQGLKSWCWDWVADDSVPDEEQLQEAIERMADIGASNFNEVDPWW